MFAGLIFATTGTTMIWPFLMIFVSERLALPFTAVTSLMTIKAVVGLAASLLAGSVVDRFGRKWVMVLGLIGNGLVYFLIFSIVNGFPVIMLRANDCLNIAPPPSAWLPSISIIFIINSISLSGRLTKDVELKYTQSGIAFARLDIAFSNSYKKDNEWVEETSYIKITLWKEKAEKAASSLHKGSPVHVDGSLKIPSYTDKNGNKRLSPEINAFKINFVEKDDYQEAPPVERHQEPVTDSEVPF